MPATSPEARARKNGKKKSERRAKSKAAAALIVRPVAKGSPEYRRKLMMMFPAAPVTSKRELTAMLAVAAANTAAMQGEG